MDWMVSAGLRPPILSSFCSLSTQGPHGFVRRYEWMLRERERWRRREERRRLLLFIFGDNKEVLMRECCVCVFNLRGDDLFSGEWGEEHEECGGRWKRNARNRRRGEKRPTYNKISWPKKTCCFLAILPTYSTTQQFSTWEFNLRIETHPRKKVEYYSHAHLNEFVVIKEYAVFNPFPPHTIPYRVPTAFCLYLFISPPIIVRSTWFKLVNWLSMHWQSIVHFKPCQSDHCWWSYCTST